MRPRRFHWRTRWGVLAIVLLVVAGPAALQATRGGSGIAPEVAARQQTETRVELGRMLFFEPRLSGDATVSCASCHAANNAFTDNLALSAGYPGNLYFRNTPTIVGAGERDWLDWDGRFAGGDLQSLIRDHLTEAHFMNMDGRLISERLKQVPEYEALFTQAWDSEPSFGGVLRSIEAFIVSLDWGPSAYDDFLDSDASALSAEAEAGRGLFFGAAGCAQCHGGASFTDGEFHRLGLPTPEEIFTTPERHIVFRRFFKDLGVPNFINLREDIGLAALTKARADAGLFRTPSLEGVAFTGPYMHTGGLLTLEEVVRFYNAGGWDGPDIDPLLQPLNLTDDEIAALVAFLHSISAEPPVVEAPSLPGYALRPLGDN